MVSGFRRTCVAAALALVVLAGCTSKPSPAASPDDDPLRPTFSETTGAIAGTVVDEEARPIPGAVVYLDDADPRTADDAGRFGWSNVEPGAYRLTATSPHHEPATRAVTVVAGGILRADFFLATRAAGLPHHEVATLDGYWSCTIAAATTHVSCYPATGEPYAAGFKYRVAPDWAAILHELTWRPSSAFTQPSEVSITFQAKNVTSGTYGVNGQVRSAPPATFLVLPGKAVNDANLERVDGASTDFALGALPIGYLGTIGTYGVGPIYQQRFTVYVTSFYAMEKPQTFSSIPDR